MYIHQDAIIQCANEAMAQTFGYASPDDLRGQDYRKLIPAHEQLHVEGSVHGLSIVSRDGQRLFANQALVTMLGYESLEAYLRHDVLDNVAPHERDRLHAYWE